MQGHYRFKSTRVKLENNSNRLKVDIDFPLWTVVLVAGHGGWLEAGVLVVEGRGLLYKPLCERMVSRGRSFRDAPISPSADALVIPDRPLHHAGPQ